MEMLASPKHIANYAYILMILLKKYLVLVITKLKDCAAEYFIAL